MVQVGLVFGGVSPEHEVSVITALQIAAALDREQYRPIPVYIAKNGSWFTGDILLDIEAYKDLDRLQEEAEPVNIAAGPHHTALLMPARKKGWFGSTDPISLEVVFLALHGGAGENGAMQGLFETMNVPYTGSGVLGSSLGMDKVVSKMVSKDQKIPVVKYVAMRESEWVDQEESWLDRCEKEIGYPAVVKPARLGSSIGIQKVDNRRELDGAIEEALRYDNKVIVEYAVRNLREINCSVLGDVDEAIASVLEEPIKSDDAAFLTFQEKYMRGGEEQGTKSSPKQPANTQDEGGMASLDRIIPAPLTEKQTKTIRELAVRIFQTFECAGLARIDFMMDGKSKKVYFNEINTIPGSFSFYLWDPSGVPFDELTHRLIQLAFSQHKSRNQRIHTYDTNLLAMRASANSGAKGKT